jgi:hypothetical protein
MNMMMMMMIELPPTKQSPAEKPHKIITEIMIYFGALE